MDMRVVKVPVHDTGIGREAGYRDDAELVEAAKAQRAELEALVSPDLLARLDAVEAELERRVIFGD